MDMTGLSSFRHRDFAGSSPSILEKPTSCKGRTGVRQGVEFSWVFLSGRKYIIRHYFGLQEAVPVIECSIIGTELLPRRICLEAADAIGSLVKSYTRLYTLQRTPSLVPYFVLTAAAVHLATMTSCTQSDFADPERQSLHLANPACSSSLDALDKDITALAEMKQCHPLAKKFLSIIAYLAEQWKVRIGSKGARFLYKTALRYAGCMIDVFNIILLLDSSVRILLPR